MLSYERCFDPEAPSVQDNHLASVLTGATALVPDDSLLRLGLAKIFF